MKFLLARILNRIGDRLIDAGSWCIRRGIELCDMPMPAEREHIPITDRPFGAPPDVPWGDDEISDNARKEIFGNAMRSNDSNRRT